MTELGLKAKGKNSDSSVEPHSNYYERARLRNWHPATSWGFLSYSQRAVKPSVSCWRKAGSNERAQLIE